MYTDIITSSVLVLIIEMSMYTFFVVLIYQYLHFADCQKCKVNVWRGGVVTTL